MVTLAVSVHATWFKLKTLHLNSPLCAVVTQWIYMEHRNTCY